MAESSIQSIRYNRLIEMIEKALARSRSGIDIKGLIQECYGHEDDEDEDGIDNEQGNTTNQVFQTMLEGVLNKAHRSLVLEMMDYLQEEKIPDVLYRFEAAIDKLNSDSELRKLANIQDKESAISAAKRIKLGNNLDSDLSDCISTVSTTNDLRDRMNDVIISRAYQKMLAEHDDLQKEVELVQKELDELENRQQVLTVETQQRLTKVQSSTRHNLDKAADMCSLLLS